MRTFIAIRVPISHELTAILSTLTSMRPALKVVAPDQLHVTLKFLGETTASQESLLDELLTNLIRQRPRCRLAFTGLGAFRRLEQPNVVWAGLSESDDIVKLATVLETCCAEIGFAPEGRPFQPHLTLARVKSLPPPTLTDFIRQNDTVPLGSFVAEALELIRSDLEPTGPRYTTLKVVPFLAKEQTLIEPT